MRVLIIGASGIIGRGVVHELGGRHELVTAGRNSGDLRVDLTDRHSITSMFERAGALDAVVAATGKVKFAPLEAMTAADYEFGLKDKLMGQVNLVLIGQSFLNDGGSFTLTTGVLDHDPIRQGSSASMVNGAVNAFVLAAAIELQRGPADQRGEPGGDPGSAARLRAVLPGLRGGARGPGGPGLRQERGGGPDRAGLPGALTALMD